MNKYQPGVGVRRVQQLLHESAQLSWSRMRQAPRLTNDHKEKRLLWAEDQLKKDTRLWGRTSSAMKIGGD